LRGFPAASDDAVVRNAIRAWDSARLAPLDDVAGNRLRTATIEWSELLGELSAVGPRPYLELVQGDAKDPPRLYGELDDGLLVDLSIDHDAFPDAPAARCDVDWVVFVEGHEGGYRAEITIPDDIPFPRLARRLVDLTNAVALGEHPFLKDW
jgi:hypothetical protein